ncbi:MAG: electron transport complex subunit E [Oscillospiraceae bacterium]|nr:electron transport complex subunit E [Oscillospiraceae bacterium]
MDPDRSYKDGLLRHNAVLSEGMVIAPLVICCDTLRKSLLLSLAFVIITVLTVLIGSCYPRRFPYAVRIILYALTASALYIPVALLCEFLSPSAYAALTQMQLPELGLVSGAAFMYLPLLSVNSFIVLHSELHFYHYKRLRMLGVLTAHAAGFTLAACLLGVLREITAYGTVFGYAVDMPVVMKGFGMPWGGFILLGLLAGAHRAIFRKKQEA